MSCTRLLPRMAGLELHYQKSWEDLDWELRKPQ